MADLSLSLTKRFALFAGLVVIAASVLMIGMYKQVASDDLNAMAERSNTAVAQIFSNVVWDAHAGFLTTAHFLSPDAIRRHPETQAIQKSLLTRLRGLSILKIKIYDQNGLTVFSTELAQIGEDKSANAGFLAARTGHGASELTHRDTFSGFEQTVEDRDVLASYVPIISASGSIEGVFEVYYDVTDLLATIQRRQTVLQIVVGSTFLLLYLLLILGVWLSERQTRRHYFKNLDLARAAARAEESNRLKSEFLATMSHELRTPLNAILGFSEILKSEIPGASSDETRREYAHSIWSSGRHLLNIVDDVLDMSKVEAGEMPLDREAFDAVHLLESCLRLVEKQAETDEVTLTSNVASGLPAGYGDERRIKQVLINLLSNAVKFTPEGGGISVWLGAAPDGALQFTVADTGIGIQPGDIEKVLTPFGQVETSYARRFGGTGLGLPIAKSLVEMHGGSFTLESILGEGTKVTFTLPPKSTAKDSTTQDAALCGPAVPVPA
ncbi:ATP-binding protein [Pelagibius sp. CAU 1746]|uniref:sensor histidine kinase n=1 Tax=Pelagibius sp. CAU 1746 TaxID=3140370 RepID=UPI00325C294C